MKRFLFPAVLLGIVLFVHFQAQAFMNKGTAYVTASTNATLVTNTTATSIRGEIERVKITCSVGGTATVVYLDSADGAVLLSTNVTGGNTITLSNLNLPTYGVIICSSNASSTSVTLSNVIVFSY